MVFDLVAVGEPDLKDRFSSLEKTRILFARSSSILSLGTSPVGFSFFIAHSMGYLLIVPNLISADASLLTLSV